MMGYFVRDICPNFTKNPNDTLFIILQQNKTRDLLAITKYNKFYAFR
jgi:hypothetical protein